MKRIFFFMLATFLIAIDVKGQAPDTLVIEYQAPVKNRFSVQGLLALRNKEQTDIDEDGVPEIVLFEVDQNGNSTKVLALDGRTRNTKWEFDLTNIQTSASSLNKISPEATLSHRDSMIWRGFRRIRKRGGLVKSSGTAIDGDRLAIMSGRFGGVLAVNPVDNMALLNLDDSFRLLAIFDIDADEEAELIILNKKARRIFIVGSGKTE